VWKAFTDLNYRRGTGFSGPLPLSYSDIEAYCRMKGIYSLGDRERLLSLLDPLDRQWMADSYKEADKKTSKNPKPGQQNERSSPSPRT
jgi:hypothetical protein